MANWGQYTSNFKMALNLFLDCGGAMNYDSGDWMVADVEMINEITTCGAKEATRRALARGGLSERRIKKIMEGWQD